MEIATAVGTSMAEKAATAAVDGLWQQLCYVLDYNDNVKDMRVKLQALKDARERVLHQVEDATKRLQEQIENDVLTWIKNVDEEISKVEKILEENDVARKSCCVRLLPNVKNRYKFSKRAKLESPTVETLAGGGKFDKVGFRIPMEMMVPVKGYEAFESRITIFESIVKKFKDGDINMVGLWGLGGIGKTTLAKKIAERVKADGIFQSVVNIHVGQNPELRKLQSEIAEWLNLKLEVESLEIRASRLSQRLKQEKSLLMILDNVWNTIELEEIGILTGSEKSPCKILVTSRNENVLQKMGAESCFLLNALSDQEAQKLFDKNVGTLEDLEMQEVATEIVTRCAGLPILIVPVATTLKNKKVHEWKNALERLKRFDKHDAATKTYAALELSYNNLEEDAKFLFLFCAQLAPSNIYIPYMLLYCVGLGMFAQCGSLEAKRNELIKVVNDIKSASLLLEGDSSLLIGEYCKDFKSDEFFRMHDVVYGFAFSMFSKSGESLILQLGSQLKEWPKANDLENYSTIFLPFCDIPVLPPQLECPKLVSFTLWSNRSLLQVPDDFFQGMQDLRVLDLHDMMLSPLPSSLKLLASLRTFYLSGCMLKDISMIGELKNLLVLRLEKSKFTHFPEEMARLTCLQTLDLRESGGIEVFPPNVLSCLTQLEELYMGDSFTKWGLKGSDGQKVNAEVAELKNLKKLTTLDIKFTDLKILQDDMFSNKLERFFIIIGDGWEWVALRKSRISRTLKLKLNGRVQAVSKVNVLLKKTEDLYLDSIGGIDVDLLQLNGEGFCHLKDLQLQNCRELRYLVNSVRKGPCTVFPRLESLVVESSPHLEQICNGPLRRESFNWLKQITVGSCDGLRNLFPFSSVKRLSRLEEVEVTDCENIEGIFVDEEINNDDDDDGLNNEVIELTLLRRLKLEYLRCLSNILSPGSGNSFGIQNEAFFNGKIIFPNIEDLILRSVKVKKIWDYGLPDSYNCITKLTTVVIDDCENVKNLFATSMLGSLAQLKKLKISNCKLLEEIIFPVEHGVSTRETKISFPTLETLHLKHLHSLVAICTADLIECSNLKVLWIEDCPKMKTFILTSINITSVLFDDKVVFPKLEELIVFNMPSLTMLWDGELHEDSFCKLKLLRVEGATNLAKLFSSSMLRKIHTLETLHLENCSSLEEIFDLHELLCEKGKIRNRVAALSSISAKRLPNLKHVWSGDPRGILSFENLQRVEVEFCRSLESLFPASVAKQLGQLEYIFLGNCSMEQIISKEERCEEVSTFVFPSLKRMLLWNITRLNSFCSGGHIVDFSAVEHLSVLGCPTLQVFEWEVQNASDTEKQSQIDEPQPLFSFEEVVPRLESMTLSSKDILMIMQRELPDIISSKLKLLDLHSFHGESANFPYKLFQRFPNLETVEASVSDFEELFTYQVLNDEKDAKTISRIKHLNIDSLHALKDIWNPQSQLHSVLQNLQSLCVSYCRSLRHVAPPSASFNNLTTLLVRNCENLASLFTCSTAASLKQLREMEVRNCNEVVEIVSASDESETVISFDKLEILKFIDLGSFRSFCSKNNTLKFPSLVELIVMECPLMEFFSSGHLRAPKLTRVWLADIKDRSRWKADLNSTIRQLYTERRQSAQESVVSDG